MSKQPLAQNYDYQTPHLIRGSSAIETARTRWGVADVLTGQEVNAHTEWIEKQTVHMGRIQTATTSILAHRQARLDQVLDIDIPVETPLFQKIMQLVMGQPIVKESPKGTTLRELINMESRLGAQIFGVIPAYDRREFYCFDDRMWIWHEERMNSETGKHDVTTVSYNITDRGILKTYGESESRYIESSELEHFTYATEEYASLVHKELYAKSHNQYIQAA